MEVRINEEYGCHVVVSNPSEVKKSLTLTPELWLITDVTLCGYCGKGIAQIQCELCYMERWCSKSCQNRANDKYHKKECNLFNEMLQNFGPSAMKIPSTARLLFRLYGFSGLSGLKDIGRYRCGSQTVMYERLKNPCDLLQMSERFKDHEIFSILWGSKDDLLRNCSENDITNAVNVITSVLNHCQPVPIGPLDEFRETIQICLAVLSMNAFAIEDHRGLMMSCTASMFNHSDASSHQVFEYLVEKESPKLKISMIDDKTMKFGEQCFIRYRPDDVVKSYFGVN